MYLVKTQGDEQQVMYAGVFFEQTCNLDFGNKTIQSIGGVCDDSDDVLDWWIFGGNYNGNGYSIKNAKVIKAFPVSHDVNSSGMGLFGIVSGSKIKNIVCENITVETYAWDGNVNREKINMDSAAIIVGRTVAPEDSTKDYNVIDMMECVKQYKSIANKRKEQLNVLSSQEDQKL